MTELDTSTRAKRPEFRNIHALSDLPGYRLPLAGLVSILHRISGVIMFLHRGILACRKSIVRGIG